MSATRLFTLEDGRVRIETFDYRSRFSLDDFLVWLSGALSVETREADSGKESVRFECDYEGATLSLFWTDEYGCVIEGTAEHADTLHRVQRRLIG